MDDISAELFRPIVDVPQGSTITITMPSGTTSKYNVYRTWQRPIYAELTRWPRLWARLRRQPTIYVQRYEETHDLIGQTD